MDDPATYESVKADPLIFGRVLNGKGGARAIDWQAAQGWQPKHKGEMLWLHLHRDAEGVQGWLSEELDLSDPTTRLLVSDATRPRAFREGQALVATLRGINLNPGAEPEDMVSMQMWCDGQRLITLRRVPMQTPRDVLALLDRGAGPVDAGATISLLAEFIIARVNDAVVDMNEHIDLIESRDRRRNDEQFHDDITEIRRNCLSLKRHMGPQHEALERISRDAPDWFEDHDRREIAESIARLRRTLDDIDVSKESAVVLQDEMRARAVARSGRTSYMLTVVATIFMPLTFFTGLLGINVSGIPAASDPDTFWIVVALCGAILLVQLVLFWRWKWL